MWPQKLVSQRITTWTRPNESLRTDEWPSEATGWHFQNNHLLLMRFWKVNLANDGRENIDSLSPIGEYPTALACWPLVVCDSRMVLSIESWPAKLLFAALVRIRLKNKQTQAQNEISTLFSAPTCEIVPQFLIISIWNCPGIEIVILPLQINSIWRSVQILSQLLICPNCCSRWPLGE